MSHNYIQWCFIISCAAGLIGAFSGPIVYERHQVMVTAVVFPLESCAIDENAKANLLNELDGFPSEKTCSVLLSVM